MIKTLVRQVIGQSRIDYSENTVLTMKLEQLINEMERKNYYLSDWKLFSTSEHYIIICLFKYNDSKNNL